MEKSFLDAIKSVNPDAHAMSKPNRQTYHKDTLADAREKVASKLDKNVEYIESDFDKAKKPDLVYTVNSYGYSVSAKYGNKWLKGLFNGEDFWGPLNKEQLVQVLKKLSEAARDGQLNNQIETAMNK